MMLNRILAPFILVVIISISNFSAAQSGFLGSTFNVTAEIAIKPTILNFISSDFSTIQSSTFSKIYYKRNVINYDFSLKADKVLSDDLQLSVGFSYSNMNLISKQVYSSDTVYYNDNCENCYNIQSQQKKLLTPIEVNTTGINIGIKKFRNGLSPVGKYFGTSVSFLQSKTEKISKIKYGDTYTYRSRYFKQTKNITESTERNVDFQGKVNTLVLNFFLGRTIPIHKKIALDFSFNAPVLRLVMFNSRYRFAATINESSIIVGDESTISNAVGYSVRKNYGFSLNGGVKFFI